ncbi:MAG: hypothetical protein ACXVEF_08895 [Polyangiales bacterium]
MKPFATLGSEINKVRERVRRGAEALRPARVANDVRDQRDRLLAKLGEQTFRLIAERKLAVPKVLQESVEKLALLLGVQLPPLSTPPEAPEASVVRPTTSEERVQSAIEGASAVASDPLEEPAEGDEPAVGDLVERAPVAKSPPKAPATKKKGHKRRKGR